MSAEKRVIFGQLGRLKPEKIEEYEALHAAPWPEVLQTIHDCNLRNWWTHTKPCFQKFSVRADSEFYADMKQIFYFA